MTAVDVHRTAAEPPGRSLASAASARPAFSGWAMPVLAAAGGLVWLSYGVFFFRAISSFSGGSLGALAVTLAALVIGLASGSYAAGKVGAYAIGAAAQRLVFNLLAAIGLGLAFLPLLGAFAWLGNAVIGIAILLVWVMARLWGTLLPCLARLDAAADARPGWRTGVLYLAAVAGCAAGCVLTAFVLMEQLGLLGIAGVLSIAGVGYVGLLLAIVPQTRDVRRRALLACGILAVLTIHVLPLGTTRILERLESKATVQLGSDWRLRPGL